MDLVTVVNRTKRNLSGRWDGKEYIVKPGKSAHPAVIAEAIKRANPVMGSDDSAGNLQYLVGVEEWGDETFPIEQSDEIELFARSKQKDAIPIMVVPGNVGMYAVNRNKVATDPFAMGGPIESGFVKP